jgi:hypothetical protein
LSLKNENERQVAFSVWRGGVFWSPFVRGARQGVAKNNEIEATSGVARKNAVRLDDFQRYLSEPSVNYLAGGDQTQGY